MIRFFLQLAGDSCSIAFDICIIYFLQRVQNKLNKKTHNILLYLAFEYYEFFVRVPEILMSLLLLRNISIKYNL